MAGNFAVEYIYRLIDKYSGPLKNLIRKTKVYKRALGQTSKKVKELNKRLKTMGRTMMSLARGAMLRITAPLTAIGVVAAVSFAKLERG